MNPEFISVIYFVASSHAAMLAAVLWWRSRGGQPGRLLAVLIGILAYKLFEGGAIYSSLYRHIPHFLDLVPGVVMLFGPILYGYVRKVTGLTPFKAKDWLLHLIPWMMFVIFLNGPAMIQTADQKIAMWEQIMAPTTGISKASTAYILHVLAIKTHLGIYLYFSWQSLNLFTRSAANLRADNSNMILLQLRSLAIAFFSLEALWLILFAAQQYAGIGTLSLVSEIWLLFISLIVMAIGFCGLQKPDLVFSPEERLLSQRAAADDDTPLEIEEPAPADDKVKYLYSALPDSAMDEIAAQIEETLKSEQLYLQEALTLTDLSRALGQKSHTISQIINQGMKTNFYKLINSYRIQHAVDLLDDPAVHWPIERIALESGFANRVTFSKAFKDHMNCTASQYKKGMQAQNKDKVS